MDSDNLYRDVDDDDERWLKMRWPNKLSRSDLSRIDAIVAKHTQQIKDAIMTSAQSVIDAITAELTGLDAPLATLLTEVGSIVAGNPPDTTALQTAADGVVTAVNSVLAAVPGQPVTPVVAPVVPPVTPLA